MAVEVVTVKAADRFDHGSAESPSGQVVDRWIQAEPNSVSSA
jgi:hypothetical protein